MTYKLVNHTYENNEILGQQIYYWNWHISLCIQNGFQLPTASVKLIKDAVYTTLGMGDKKWAIVWVLYLHSFKFPVKQTDRQLF